MSHMEYSNSFHPLLKLPEAASHLGHQMSWGALYFLINPLTNENQGLFSFLFFIFCFSWLC